MTTRVCCAGFSDEIASGFGGDVFGIDVPSELEKYQKDIAPSMGNDDYMADLDSVNISQRILSTYDSSRTSIFYETSIMDVLKNIMAE